MNDNVRHTQWKTLSSSPYLAAPNDGKWGDIKTAEVGLIPVVKPEDVHKAQLNVAVVATRKRVPPLSNAEAKELLSALGIDERVNLDDDDCKDS
jgi:hypothetical protein